MLKSLEYILKNIDRSYEKVFEFIKEVDFESLSAGKSININLIKKSIKQMNKYRSHNCSELREKDIGKECKTFRWLHRKRDHGNLLFLDVRDHFGITQCVIENKDKNFQILEKLKPESIILIVGSVIKRTEDTENKDLDTLID